MATNKLSQVLKHKRIIFISLIAIGFIIVVLLTYILTYVNNKPVIFEDKKAKIIKNEDIKGFDLDVTASKITYKKGSSNGSLKYIAKISNIKDDIKNVSIQYELNTNWVDTRIKDSTTDKFNDGDVLEKGETYSNTTHSTSLTQKLPIKVLPFVKVSNKDIIIYAKITYTTVSISSNPDLEKEKTIYTYFTFDDYFKDNITTIA